MTTTVTTSTITFTHDGVYITASGRIKIAETPGKKWRIWIYDEHTWQQQPEIFKKRENAAAAAELADVLLTKGIAS